MKKLLALILCVMMFVAVIPTAAFAASTGLVYNSGANSGWNDLSVAKKAVDKASANIERMMKGIAADQGVYGTVTAIDNMVTSMSKAMFADLDDVLDFGSGSVIGTILGTNDVTKIGTMFDSGLAASGIILTSDLTDATTKYLRQVIGAEIGSYMNKHKSSYIDSTTGFVKDPQKYLEAFATAASDAISSEKAVKNIEALMLEMAAISTMKSVNDAQSDLFDEIAEWDSDNKILKQYGFTAVSPESGLTAPLAFFGVADYTLGVKMAGQSPLADILGIAS